VAKPYCGDGTVNQDTEGCDDGNAKDGDGCSALCKLEGPAWKVVAEWPLTSKPSGAIVANGGAGGQGVTTLGGAGCWNQTSDWNYLWIPHPDPLASRIRVEVDLYANTTSWGFMLSPLVDGPQYKPDTYIVHGVGLGSYMDGGIEIWQVISYTKLYPAKLSGQLQKPNTWVSLRYELDRLAKTVTVYRDNLLIGSWPISLEALKGDKILLNSGVPFSGSHCWKNLKLYTAF